jgi:sulfate adenylyltransferase
MSVAQKMHTVDGLFWPVPILNLTESTAEIDGADRIACEIRMSMATLSSRS